MMQTFDVPDAKRGPVLTMPDRVCMLASCLEAVSSVGIAARWADLPTVFAMAALVDHHVAAAEFLAADRMCP